jgi:ketosteroid isomerase-like protein
MKRALEGFANQGWESVMPLFADDFELTTPPGLAAEPDTYRGEEGMRRYWESFYDVMDEIRVEPKEFREIEDWVLAPFTMTARGRTTGIESGIEAVMAWRWRDGKAIRALLYPDLEEALAAIPPRD